MYTKDEKIYLSHLHLQRGNRNLGQSSRHDNVNRLVGSVKIKEIRWFPGPGNIHALKSCIYHVQDDDETSLYFYLDNSLPTCIGALSRILDLGNNET